MGDWANASLFEGEELSSALEMLESLKSGKLLNMSDSVTPENITDMEKILLKSRSASEPIALDPILCDTTGDLIKYKNCKVQNDSTNSNDFVFASDVLEIDCNEKKVSANIVAIKESKELFNYQEYTEIYQEITNVDDEIDIKNLEASEIESCSVHQEEWAFAVRSSSSMEEEEVKSKLE